MARTQFVILLGLLAFRLLNAHSIRTFFQPDEYFQSLEPAWQAAFGLDSGAWITWEWKERLRSSMHPLLFAMVYSTADRICRLLPVSGPRRVDVLLAAPGMVQALFAAIMDYFTWRLAAKIYGRGTTTTSTALALTVFSPWQWYCSTRTFSNSLETTLTVVALDLFPWRFFLSTSPDPARRDSRAGIHLSLLAAATACVLRPTNIILWVTVSVCLAWQSNSLQKMVALAQTAVVCGMTILVTSATMDHAYYGEWTFPPLRFLHFNLVQSISVFYGANRLDYYFTEGMPLLLLTALPFGNFGVFESLRDISAPYFAARVRFVLAAAVTATVVVLTLIAHKEVRFIYPLLPILHVLAASPLARFFAPFPVPKQKFKAVLLLAGVLVNIYIAGYVSLVHQRGVIDVIHYLRHAQQARLNQHDAASTDTNVTVGFMVPCHSTPWRAYMIYPEIDAWALTCEPPLNLTPEQRMTYLDEADVFYADPVAWIESNMAERRERPDVVAHGAVEDAALPVSAKRRWPEFLVFFSPLQPILQATLAGGPYQECKRFFNTHWHDDARRKGDIVVWCMSPKH